MAKLLDYLELRWCSRKFLIVAWKFKCQQTFEFKPQLPGEFSREDFIGGLVALGCDSVNKLKDKLPRLESYVKEYSKFSEMYHFTFHYALSPGQEVN